MKKQYHSIILILVLCGLCLTPSVLAVIVPPDGGGSGRPTSPRLYSIPTPESQAQLSWSSSSGATSYKIFRSKDYYSGYSQIASTTSCSYVDSSAAYGSWWYYVKASNSYGDSYPSNRHLVMITPLEITSPGRSSIPIHSGYYPSTYGFDCDNIGSEPSGWVSDNTGIAYTKVIDSIKNHKKVLECCNNYLYDGCYSISNNFGGQVEGFIEFYMMTSSADLNHFALYSDEEVDPIIWFRIESNQIIYLCEYTIFPDPRDPPITEIFWAEWPYAEIYTYLWYHIKIKFNCEYNTFTLTLNDNNNQEISSEFLVDVTHLNRIRFFSEGINPEDEACWIDAVAYSWDDFYIEGANLYEGQLLKFSDKDSCSSFQYKVDGGSLLPIPGDFVIPFPDGESHTLQVYGTLTNGEQVYSKVKQYSMYGAKIGVFIWADDCCWYSTIFHYIDIIKDRQYTKIFEFQNSRDWKHDLYLVDSYETSLDIIFFYIFGHGWYFNENDINHPDDSCVRIRPPRAGNEKFIYSSELITEVDKLETQRIGLLIESCYSEGFCADFNKTPYILISTADYTHEAGGWADTSQGVDSDGNYIQMVEAWFSKEFWNRLNFPPINIYVAYTFASSDILVQPQGPKIVDHSNYVFFG